MNNNSLKCAYCNYTCARYYVNKTGQKKSGLPKLEHHVHDNHFDKFLEEAQKNGLTLDELL